MKWKCHIPGKEGTIWEGGFYPLSMEFTEDYPAKPPKVRRRRSSGGAPAALQRGPQRAMRRPCARYPPLLLMLPPLPCPPRAVQVPRQLLPPQHLPLRHRLPLHPERGRELAALHHRQANPARRAGGSEGAGAAGLGWRGEGCLRRRRRGSRERGAAGVGRGVGRRSGWS